MSFMVITLLPMQASSKGDTVEKEGVRLYLYKSDVLGGRKMLLHLINDNIYEVEVKIYIKTWIRDCESYDEVTEIIKPDSYVKVVHTGCPLPFMVESRKHRYDILSVKKVE